MGPGDGLSASLLSRAGERFKALNAASMGEVQDLNLFSTTNGHVRILVTDVGFHCECERASLATCALSSHPHYRYSILPMLIILVGCVILFRRTTSYFQISIMILQPYEDDWYLILRLSG